MLVDILSTEIKVLKHLSLLKCGINNEPAVRFAITNHLTTLICKHYRYQLQLEERVDNREVSGLGARRALFNVWGDLCRTSNVMMKLYFMKI